MLTRSVSFVVGGVYNAHVYLAGLGFDTIPLKPYSKSPIFNNWPLRVPTEMWDHAPKDANLGIRFAGKKNIASIDSDDKNIPGTFVRVKKLFEELGYSLDQFPVIQTASRHGRHIYFQLDQSLDGSFKILNKTLGAGEFRYGNGAFNVAPPSIVDGSIYRIIHGNFSNLPTIPIEVINQFVDLSGGSLDFQPATMRIPRNPYALLKGINHNKYPSRSEVDQGVVLGLVNKHFTFAEIYKAFLDHSTNSKFLEKHKQNPKIAEKYLRNSYNNAIKYADKNESLDRRKAYAIFEEAKHMPWPKKTGQVDRVVYMALGRIAFESGKLEIHASCRDLAILAGIAYKTAANSTIRLEKQGLIFKTQNSIAKFANKYLLLEEAIDYTLPHISDVWECVTLANHDIFRWGGFSKSALQIYEHLQEHPCNLEEIQKRTGRSKDTIIKSIFKMNGVLDSGTGEKIVMIECINGLYFAKIVDYDLIAEILGTAGKKDSQIQKHKEERKLHRELLNSSFN